MDMENIPQKEAIRNALYNAALSCNHSIEHHQIILRRDDNLPGNALAQMATRLAEAFEKLCEPNMASNPQPPSAAPHSPAAQLRDLLRGLGAGDILTVADPDLLYRFGVAIAEQVRVGNPGKAIEIPIESTPTPDYDVVKVIDHLLRFAYDQVCVHEETHRGGAIWEICDSCGAKWADDEGGKPEFVWPAAIVQAENFVELIRSQQNIQAITPAIDSNISAEKVSWVKCPVCGEDDMRQTIDDDGAKLIRCSNHGCLSNGGTMCDGLPSGLQRI